MARFRPDNVESDVKAVRNAFEGRISQFGPFKSGNELENIERDIVKQHDDGERRDKNSRLLIAGHIVGLQSGG